MDIINNYRILNDFQSGDAGQSRWSFCEKENRVYFIKEFLNPKYPVDDRDLSKATIERRRYICDKFYAEKSSFYRRLETCRSGNIVIIQDFFRYGPRYYIVTEKIKNVISDKSAVLNAGFEQKMVLTRSLLYSFGKLHKEGLVHADVKEDNVLIKKTEDGYFTGKVIDFDSGFIEREGIEELHGDFVYLAPESLLRINGEQVDLTHKIDIFALGILLHLYWSGEYPGYSRTYHYACEALINGGSIRLSPNLPGSLHEVIGKMLSLYPRSRPDAAELLNMLSTSRRP